MRWPSPGELNDAILEAAQQIPEGGGYRFVPAAREPMSPINPRDPGYDGVSRDLFIGEQRVARAAGDGVTYCCGVTFEAFFDAVQRWMGAWPDELGPDNTRAMIMDWFCPVMGHSGVVDALVRRGLGVRVAEADALPGDLCQFWRSVDLGKPSGHSVVFLGWETSDNGARCLRYWSSQGSTGGVGVHSEVVGPGWDLHFVRVGR